MELYATGEGILEIEYYDEIGTGLGPTLEFYTEASKQFARRALNLWRDEDETKAGDHVFHPKGLYPSPMSATDSPEWVCILSQVVIDTDGFRNQIKLHWLKVLGTFVGRAILDSRMIDVDLNKVLLKQILDYPVKRNIATLKLVDEQLARSLERLQSYLFARKEIEALPLVRVGWPLLHGLRWTTGSIG
jgi:E3 ubiquitin-protein ligase TRIP12